MINVNTSQLGFTLIELLVVVLIIGILASVALPQYQVAVDKARAKSVMSLLKSVKQANQLFYMENGYYTNDFAQWTISFPSGTTFSGSEIGMGSLYLPDGTFLQLVSSSVTGASLPRVQGYSPGSPVTLHVFYDQEKWLCYPRGTDRGWRICKALGCTQRPTQSGAGCEFKPA